MRRFGARRGRVTFQSPRPGRRAPDDTGLIERLGRVTIAWVKPPAAALRESVHDCVAGAKP